MISFITPNGYLYSPDEESGARFVAMCPVDDNGLATVTFYWDPAGVIDRVTVMSVYGPKFFERKLTPGIKLDRKDPLSTLEQVCHDVYEGSTLVLTEELLDWITKCGNHKSFLEKYLDPLCEGIWRFSLLAPWAKKA